MTLLWLMALGSATSSADNATLAQSTMYIARATLFDYRARSNLNLGRRIRKDKLTRWNSLAKWRAEFPTVAR